jgi:hypothetical protein
VTEKKLKTLSVEAEATMVIFFQGAALSALLTSTEQRVRETGEEMWKQLPFLKALTALARRHPEEALALWKEALQEPMPFGGAPLGLYEEEKPPV